jgi:hypothetical protein
MLATDADPRVPASHLVRGNWIAGLMYERSPSLLQGGNRSRVESSRDLPSRKV